MSVVETKLGLLPCCRHHANIYSTYAASCCLGGGGVWGVESDRDVKRDGNTRIHVERNIPIGIRSLCCLVWVLFQSSVFHEYGWD